MTRNPDVVSLTSEDRENLRTLRLARHGEQHGEHLKQALKSTLLDLQRKLAGLNAPSGDQ